MRSVKNPSNARTVFYQLRDEQRLAGVMGVRSATRCKLDKHPELVMLLNGVSTCMQYCSSSGIGEDLRKGLIGFSASEFEACEEEVGQLIYGW